MAPGLRRRQQQENNDETQGHVRIPIRGPPGAHGIGQRRGDRKAFWLDRLGPEAVYLNDYVRHEGKQLLALKITVAELADAESGEETLR